MLRRSGSARSIAVWLALASILLLNLLPTFSRLADPVRSAEWVALCRGNSTVWVNLADAARPAGERSAPAALDHLFQHCPYCTLHVDLDRPVSVTLQVPSLGAWQAELPRAWLHAPATLPVWRVAQPRAPPQQG